MYEKELALIANLEKLENAEAETNTPSVAESSNVSMRTKDPEAVV